MNFMKSQLINKFLFLCILFLSITTVLSAQEKVVSGVVYDDEKNTVIGAYIKIAGKNTSGITDVDGRFSIRAADRDTLIISYIGYAETRVPVNGQNTLTVTLLTDTKSLQEVVIVGYGSQQKASVVGAIAQVTTKELQQSPVANVSNALAGRLPGLITVQRTGEPGNDMAEMYIRGVSTYAGSVSPLVLVDGIERDIRLMDVSEIESISILKDASATAVYGVRGANGVVVVTTKRGEIGKNEISLSIDGGIQMPTRMLKNVNSYEMAVLTNEALMNDGLSPKFSQEALDAFRNGTNEFLYPNNDWFKESLNSYSIMDQYNLTVRGGVEKVKYFVAANILNQGGLYKYSDYNPEYNTNISYTKYNFRSNLDLQLSSIISAKLNLAGIIGTRHSPNQDANTVFERLRISNPDRAPIRNPDGTWATREKGNFNPLANIIDAGYRDSKETSVQATLGFSADLAKLTKGLSANVDYSFDFSNVYNKSYTKPIEFWEFYEDGTYQLFSEGGNLGFGDELNAYNSQYVFEPSLRYANTFGSVHRVTGLALFTMQERLQKGNSLTRLPYRRMGIVGRITYAYKDKYLAEVNAGYNGSENFAPGHRFGFFPAFSAGWVATEEDFFQSSWINFLKLRASYGKVGNDRVGGDRFLYESLWESAGEAVYGMASPRGAGGGAREKRIGNENLTWETAAKVNIGIEGHYFGNKLDLTVDVFNEDRSHILSSINIVPGTFGGPSLMDNVGSVNNKGFEVEGLFRGKAGNNFNYWFGGNYSYARNKITEMPEAPQAYDYLYATGQRVGQPFGYISRGIFQSNEEVLQSPSQNGLTLQAGDVIYIDINGDGIVDSNDRHAIGFTSVPEMFYSFKFGFDYKRFDLSCMFQGAGNVTYNFMNALNVPFWNENNTPLTEWLDRWTPENRDARYPRISFARPNNNNYESSTFWHRNGNYIRFKNFEVGYVIPEKFISKIGAKYTRFYINGMNLFTWTKVPVYDPENIGTRYPLMLVVNAGVKLTF
jgi:TonB-linked SusC/RagA family outer membrane protein